nr:ABC transporter ATP-binding protein [Hyphomicrobium methylovorum]
MSVGLKGREVVRDVSFSISAGEVVGLIGPNGAGKSTLLRTTAGLLPSHGAITLDGQRLEDLGAHARAKLIGYLPQEREVAWPITASRLVALGRTPHLAPFSDFTREDRTIADEALRQVDAAEFQDRVVSELSGGERARVLIARMLAQQTPIIIADEPTAGLDPGHQISLVEILTRLAEDGRTIVLALHEVALAARWCTRILLLNQGRIVADGPPKEVLTSGLFERTYGVRVFVADGPDGFIIQPISRI